MQEIIKKYINQICPSCINKDKQYCEIKVYKACGNKCLCCKCAFYNNVGKEIHIRTKLD